MSDEAHEARKAIGRRLREARKLAGLSQAQAASLLRLHRPAVSEIEAGNRRVSATELGVLCETYEVDLSWVLGKVPEQLEADDDRFALAARELAKLKPAEIERLLRLLASMKTSDHAPED